MNESYSVLYRAGASEETVKKSRFLSRAVPVSSEEGAAAVLDKIRKEHWDANHHCYAFTLGPRGEICRSSDDHEPAGTAGRPILEVLLASGVRTALIVVTRYFGGILLGTGGLVRAYGSAARKALENASLLQLTPGEEWTVRTEYPQLGAVQKLAKEKEYYLAKTEYGEKVLFDFYISHEQLPGFLREIPDLTLGRAEMQKIRSLTFGLTDGALILPEDLPEY